MERKEAIQKLSLLLGKELHDLAKQHDVVIHKNGKTNKGWAGHTFERYLELPINSAQSPNFGSWELKSIPLKFDRSGNLKVKETMAITMIDSVNICQKEFEDSHLLAKLRKAVIVARTVGKHVDEPSYIHSIIEFDLTGDMYEAIRQDYNVVRNALLNPDPALRVLKSEMGIYIQPRTKGAKNSTSRAFYARASFLSLLVNLKRSLKINHPPQT